MTINVVGYKEIIIPIVSGRIFLASITEYSNNAMYVNMVIYAAIHKYQVNYQIFIVIYCFHHY